jgi:Family of unknown function (DUF6506)
VPLCRYAFVVKAAGYKSETHKAVFDSPLFHTTMVGVASVDDALPVARDLAANGVQLIELCGGFTVTEAATIQQHVGTGVLIGVVTFTAAQEAKMGQLFGAA